MTLEELAELSSVKSHVVALGVFTPSYSGTVTVSESELEEYQRGKHEFQPMNPVQVGRDRYTVDLVDSSDLEPFHEEVRAISRSKFEGYRRGDYELQVIEAEQLTQGASKWEVHEAIIRMCSKFGEISYIDNTVDMSHEERVRLAEEIAGKLVQRPYVDAVFLTGSTARGQDRSDSDIDILVVLGYCPGNSGHVEMNKLGTAYVDFYRMQQRDFSMAQGSQYPLIRDSSLLASKL